jgi:hypothetical protein
MTSWDPTNSTYIIIISALLYSIILRKNRSTFVLTIIFVFSPDDDRMRSKYVVRKSNK